MIEIMLYLKNLATYVKRYWNCLNTQKDLLPAYETVYSNCWNVEDIYVVQIVE